MWSFDSRFLLSWATVITLMVVTGLDGDTLLCHKCFHLSIVLGYIFGHVEVHEMHTKTELKLKSMIVFIDGRERERERTLNSLLEFFFLTHLNPNIYTSGPALCRIIQSHRLTTVPHTLSAGYQGDREERSVKWSNGLALFIYLQANGSKQ